MAAVSHVFTLACVAEFIGEDEDWLLEISIEMEPEDGLIGIHDPDDTRLPSLTSELITCAIVEVHRQDAAHDTKLTATKPKPGC